ncbi:MAG TPA: AI-2E family transporter [Dissulfurispiraceae bacterium]|nr:AI-2E family transporter [Dissulfurispiraceae bacterium]
MQDTETEKQKPTGSEIAAWLMACAGMLLVLELHLLPALLSGMLVYELVHSLSKPLRYGRMIGARARVVVVAFLAILVAALFSLLVWVVITFFRSDAGNIPALLHKMAEIIEEYREALPGWLQGYFPLDSAGIREGIVSWLREHAKEVQMLGKETARVIIDILVGMVIGTLISLREVVAIPDCGPLARALSERAARFGQAFRSVVFAQVRIATLNSLFAAIYLGVLLPIFGIHLSLVKTMVAITFIAGMIPVIGNVISNSVIVVVSLGSSFSVAGASLVFLVLIHKLEYFLNARIIGARIHAHAWELLIVMLTMEAAFGIAGVVAAPIYYAYIKGELADRGLL